MYNELIDIDVMSIQRIYDVHNARRDQTITPIVNSLIDKFNNFIKTGYVLESGQCKFHLHWYNNKYVTYTYVAMKLEFETPSNFSGYEVSREFVRLMRNKYPLAKLEIHPHCVDDVWSVYITFQLRDDGLPFPKE